uniref:Uncharacterized protein n=1 Tax=Euplotes harpa TaxID=151035 RepID=A0A7S3NG19_9SPIT|mmetsp:Transcript_7668/g.8666  ORF Transcript_7668/g.8666 Transcript_7668/m.8666 type:complete len:196 (+) Transcript_7668:530-1117(+)
MLIPLIINCSVLWVTDNYLMDSSGLYTLYFRHNSKRKSNESSEASLESLKVLKTPLLPSSSSDSDSTMPQHTLTRGEDLLLPVAPPRLLQKSRATNAFRFSGGSSHPSEKSEEKQKQSQGQVVQHVLRETAQSTPVRTTMRKFGFNKEEYYHVSVGLPKAENKEAPPMAISKETAQGLKINRRKTLIKRATVADL